MHYNNDMNTYRRTIPTRKKKEKIHQLLTWNYLSVYYTAIHMCSIREFDIEQMNVHRSSVFHSTKPGYDKVIKNRTLV